MRKNYFYLLVFMLLASNFFIVKNIHATNTDIIINEIGASPTSTHEWVEIYNKGSASVDITGWKFWEASTNHGLTVNSSDSILQPGEYAAITQDNTQFLADHPSFAGSIFDSSWTSLSESGEEIGLKDSANIFIEQFTYLATPNHHSLERKNATLADYTSSNWQEHVSGDTVGSQNSNVIGGGSSPSPDIGGGGASASVGKATGPTGSDAVFFWSKIKLNEIMVDPGNGAEWIELYNPSASDLDLTGGTLCDGRANSSCTIASINGSIPAFGWRVITLTNDHLNNSGDIVILKDFAGTSVDQVAYNNSLLPKTGQALARKADGVDSNSDNADWAVTTQPTAGSTNIIIVPPAKITDTNASAPTTNNQPPITSLVWATSTSPLIINELLPDPEGSDLTDEFIEIKNITSSAVNLSGWKLSDTTKNFNLTGTIGPGELAVFTRPLTGISLNNTTDEEIRLSSASGAIADNVSYDSAEPKASYSRSTDGTWHWTTAITKGFANNIETVDSVEIIWKINAPKFAAPGDVVEFSALGSADPRGGTLHYSWNFGDGTSGQGETASHVFIVQGTYTITLSTSSTAGTIGQKKLTLSLAPGLATDNRSIVISEIFPNPTGPDTSEFIELYNSASNPADISLWQLKLSSDKTFTLPNDTRIQAHETLVFYRLVTHLSLLNSADIVELLTASGQSVVRVNYLRSVAGRSYTKGDKGWVWTLPTPGRVTAPSLAPQIVLGQKIVAPAIKQSVQNFVVNTGRDIAAIRDLAKGAYVRFTGLVTALPGTFSAQYFYVDDGSAGIQIYSNKKTFPELALGDRVAIAGKTSTANSIPRINISRSDDVDILSTNGILVAEPIALDEMENVNAGSLMSAQGEITKLTNNLMYVDDGRGEIPVYFKAGAKIDKQAFNVGDQIKVTGILEHPESGAQLWPRSQNDIEIIFTKPVATANSSPNTTTAYTLVTVSGLSLMGLAAIGKKRILSLTARFLKKPPTT